MAIPRLAWVVLALTLTGALGALFGPQERRWGVDIGSTGATVFGATLWVGVAPFAACPERIFSQVRSIAERRARAGLFFGVPILMAYVCFMWTLGRLPETPDSIDELPAAKLAWWLAPMIAANVLVGILIAKPLVEHAYFVGRYARDRR